MVLDAIVTDAAFSPQPAKKSKPETPEKIIAEMKKWIDPDHQSISSGDCFRIRSKNILGGGNIYDGHLCHFVAFAKDIADMDEHV